MTEPDDIARRPRLLIPDTTPLSLLALIGGAALDWLFVPGADVWISDMVRQEAIRDPDPGDDQRLQHRAVLKQWFARNANRIHIKPTREGEEYAKAMQNWQLAGARAELKPSWKGRGERSVLQVLEVVESVLADGEAVVVLVDDNKARIAIQLESQFDLDLMGTESFVSWMRDRFHMPNAEHAWTAIRIAAGGNVPETREDDPVLVRR